MSLIRPEDNHARRCHFASRIARSLNSPALSVMLLSFAHCRAQRNSPTAQSPRSIRQYFPCLHRSCRWRKQRNKPRLLRPSDRSNDAFLLFVADALDLAIISSEAATPPPGELNVQDDRLMESSSANSSAARTTCLGDRITPSSSTTQSCPEAAKRFFIVPAKLR